MKFTLYCVPFYGFWQMYRAMHTSPQYFTGQFRWSKIFLCIISPLLKCLTTSDRFYCLYSCVFTECHTNRIFKYMALGVWLLLLTRKYFKSDPFHCLNQYCWLYSITFYGCTHLPIYTPVQGYLGCFQFLMSKNKAV